MIVACVFTQLALVLMSAAFICAMLAYREGRKS